MDAGDSSPALKRSNAEGSSAAAGTAEMRILEPSEYLVMRNFISLNEASAKSAREAELAVFDQPATDLNGGGADFGAEWCSILSEQDQRLQAMVEELSPQQRDLYDCVVHYCSPGSKVGELLVHVAGAAGVGKTKVTMTIAFYMHVQYGSKSVAAMAITNLASGNVNGHTIDSLFPSILTENTTDPKRVKLKAAALKTLQAKFDPVHLLIFEEHGTISCEFFYRIDQSLRFAFPKANGRAHDLPFAGRHVRCWLRSDCFVIRRAAAITYLPLHLHSRLGHFCGRLLPATTGVRLLAISAGHHSTWAVGPSCHCSEVHTFF
jgi:Ni2+-binding GTPase involved in maturation of urease and hydrogenase